MDGVAAIRQLLAGDSDLIALVPAAKIMTGVLAQGTQPPALSISRISSVARQPLAAGAVRHFTDRVQVTAVASTYPQLRLVLATAVLAAADKRPIVAGITHVFVRVDGAGPDLRDDEAALQLGTQDFLVSYNKSR